MKKSILALLLAVLMVASLLPAAALADGEMVAEVNGEQYDTLAEAITKANAGDTVYLLQNLTISAEQEIDKGITLNLGGNTLTLASATGTTNAFGLKFTSGTSHITNGTIVDERSDGNTSYGWITVSVVREASLSIDNTNIYVCKPCGLTKYNYAVRAIGNEDGVGTLTLNAGTEIGEVENSTPGDGSYGVVGVTVFGEYGNGNEVQDDYAGETIVVNSGVVIDTTGYAISGNGNSHGTTITINGGTMTAEESTGIYHPQTGTLNINGGSITGGVTGIEIRSGELNMTGGVVTGLGNPTKVEPNGNGTTSSGAGIAIAQHTTKLPIALNVTGGTVKGFSAIYENNPQNNSEDDLNKIELNINGGEFNAINNGTAVIHSQDFEDFVTKGEFNQPVDAKYLDNDLLFEVNNHDTYTYYDTFENALKAAEYGAKITGIAEGLDTPYYDLVIDPANGGEVKSVNAPRGSTFTLPTVTKSGYAFLGWACSDGKTYSALQEVTITANTTFTASWVRHPDTEYVPEPEEPEEPEVPAFPFYDVPTSAWYYTAVKYVYDNKLMDGVDTYVFAPNDTLTRAMVWTIIARMSGVDTTGGNTWYAKAQEWVITNGISDGENPTAAITRQELVTMLYRYAQIKGYDVSVGEDTNILSYVDATSISEYAMSAFQWACGSGLTEGDENGALTPLATATRAQAAAMIMRFLSK